MVQCKNCKWCIGYDVISKRYICDATSDIEYVEVETALNDDLGCDFFVDNSNDDTTARS